VQRCKSKRNIEMDFQDLEQIINIQNNHFIQYNDTKFSLNTIYETYLYQCFEFNRLIDINYFKNFFTIITKLIIYRYISKYFNVLIKRNIKADQINYNESYKWLSNYKYIIKLIKEKNKEFIKFI